VYVLFDGDVRGRKGSFLEDDRSLFLDLRLEGERDLRREDLNVSFFFFFFSAGDPVARDGVIIIAPADSSVLDFAFPCPSVEVAVATGFVPGRSTWLPDIGLIMPSSVGAVLTKYTLLSIPSTPSTPSVCARRCDSLS